MECRTEAAAERLWIVLWPRLANPACQLQTSVPLRVQNGGGMLTGRIGVSDPAAYVMLPRARADKGSGLREWDLWGPLVLCLALGIMLSMRADQASLAFALVFVIVWVGSGIVTLNAVLLKGKISFFQSVCVLGYCIFPLVIAAFCSLLLQVIWLKVIFVCVGFTWATGASVAFMSELLPEDRKALGVYPVWLFYVAIAWLILIS
ncbi:yipf6 [Symbiodinium microadriaticum]|nr:yipf6 [Symbiodinium microadriaticum]